jgi:hypothetical protein
VPSARQVSSIRGTPAPPATSPGHMCIAVAQGGRHLQGQARLAHRQEAASSALSQAARSMAMSVSVQQLGAIPQMAPGGA